MIGSPDVFGVEMPSLSSQDDLGLAVKIGANDISPLVVGLQTRDHGGQ